MLRWVLAPLPVADFREIFAVLIDVEFMFDELVLHFLLEISPPGSEMGQAIHRILHEMKAVEIVLDPHIEGRGDGSLFLVTPDMQIAIGTPIGQPVNK